MGVCTAVPESSGAHHMSARIGAGNHARDVATNVHPVCCTDTVRSLTYEWPSGPCQINGRRRYGERPWAEPTSVMSPGSSTVPSPCVLISSIVSLQLSFEPAVRIGACAARVGAERTVQIAARLHPWRPERRSTRETRRDARLRM